MSPLPSAPSPSATPLASKAPAEVEAFSYDSIGSDWWLITRDAENDDQDSFGNSPAPQEFRVVSPTLEDFEYWSAPEGMAGRLGFWTGSELLWQQRVENASAESAANGDPGITGVFLIDPRAGKAANPVVRSEWGIYLESPLADGSWVGGEQNDNAQHLQFYSNDLTSTSAYTVGSEQDCVNKHTVNSSGTTVVCLTSAGSGSDVIVIDQAGPHTARVVDHFRAEPYDYQFAGWVDKTTFIIGKTARDSPTPPPEYYSYNIATRKISDYTFVREGGSAADVGYMYDAGGYSVQLADIEAGGAVAVVDAETSELIATLPCWPNALAPHSVGLNCRSAEGIWVSAVFSLETGEQFSFEDLEGYWSFYRNGLYSVDVSEIGDRFIR